MIETITFKTELSEILTLEEVAILFDCIKNKSQVEMISLSILPKFNKLRRVIIKKTAEQRNAELSKLLMELANRKQEIKINIWKTLSNININKKQIQNNPERVEELEQIVYEEEQIIKAYENSINTLGRKEKRIMNGKYSRLDKVKALCRKKVLKKQLEELRERLSQISANHDNCFQEYMEELKELIELSLIKIPTNLNTQIMENPIRSKAVKMNNKEEKMNYERKSQNKEFYLYEPSKTNLDDELIYQLLSQGKYNLKDGTINDISLLAEVEEL